MCGWAFCRPRWTLDKDVKEGDKAVMVLLGKDKDIGERVEVGWINFSVGSVSESFKTVVNEV